MVFSSLLWYRPIVTTAGGREMKILTPRGKWLMALACFLYTAQSVLFVCIAYVDGRLIDCVTAADLDGLLRTALLSAGMTVVSYGMDAAMMSSRLAAIADGEVGLKTGIMGNLLRRPLKKFREEPDAFYLNLLTNDVELFQQYLRYIPLFFTSAASILAASWMLFRMHPLLLLTALIAAAIPLAVMKPFTKLGTKCANAYSKAAESYTGVLKETIEGCETIRAAGAEEPFQQRYAAAGRTRQRAWSKNDLVGNMTFQTLLSVASLASVACTVLGGWLTIRGVMTVGMLFAARTYFVNISNYFSNLTGYIVEIRASKRIREKLRSQMQLPCPADSGLPLSPQPEAVYDNVSFAFGGRQLYSGLTARFAPGGCYAVVGESGSGKSTLVKLLLKYYDDYQGTISLAGQDIRRLSEREVYKLVGVVDQTPYLFNASLYENITLFSGWPGQDTVEYRALLRKLNLTGLARQVGDAPLGDLGDKLSGGERQRINIARALRLEPKILIFDEPTTGLDPENVDMINEFIFALQGVTRIVVSHDWSADYLGRFNGVIRIGNETSRQ